MDAQLYSLAIPLKTVAAEGVSVAVAARVTHKDMIREFIRSADGVRSSITRWG